MSQIREGLSRAWDSITEGWRELRASAAESLTRFHPTGATGGGDQLPAQPSVRWGLLAAEVEDGDDEVVVRLEAPGMNADDFEIDVIGELLVVRGEKRVVRDGRRGELYVSERAYGRFERAIRLPGAVDERQAIARYRSGVLTVTLPKVAGRGRTRITVSEG
jgi:HSP20 family protein